MYRREPYGRYQKQFNIHNTTEIKDVQSARLQKNSGEILYRIYKKQRIINIYAVDKFINATSSLCAIMSLIIDARIIFIFGYGWDD